MSPSGSRKRLGSTRSRRISEVRPSSEFSTTCLRSKVCAKRATGHPARRRPSALAVSPDDPAHGWVVCRNVDLDRVAGDDADHATLAHLARSAGGHLVACLQLHAKRRVRERFNHDALCSEVVVLACDVSLLSIRPSSTAHEGYTADRQHAAAYRFKVGSGTSEDHGPRTTDHGPGTDPSPFSGDRSRALPSRIQSNTHVRPNVASQIASDAPLILLVCRAEVP